MSEILVTGATRGIGRAVTEGLVVGGHRVFGVYRSSHDVAQAMARDLGPAFVPLAADLVDPSAIAALPARIQGVLGGVVFNAGEVIRGELATAPAPGTDPLLRQIDADLAAPLLLCRALLLADALAAGASLVFIGSNLARRGLAGRVAYAAAKAGIEGAVRSLARELGPRGVRVNAVAPGLLRTDMTADLDPGELAEHARAVPLGRVGSPADVAGVVIFLLGSAAAYVTGQVIDVDGGFSA